MEADQPFGVGKLFLSLDRARLDRDLVLSFTTPHEGNLAVQLADAEERLLAVDLLAYRSPSAEGSVVTTLVVPLSRFPTARHLVLRRLDGPVEIAYLALLPLAEPAPADPQELRELALRLGDPLAPDSELSTQAGPVRADGTPPEPAAYQPLLARAREAGAEILDEASLLELFRFLGLQGYDFTSNDFVRAAGEGREEVVRLYLRAGMPIDVQGRNRYTAAAEAATSGELGVLRLLSERGADLEIRTAGGNTALWMAAYNTNFEAIRLLVEYGADVNAQGARQEVPANILMQWRQRHRKGTLASLKFLLENGADPDITDARQRTLLHAALEDGWTHELNEILRYEPDLEKPDRNGMRPIMLAHYQNNNSRLRA